MSPFSFIDNKILRQNLNIAFDHINELIVVSESAEYKNKKTQINSFRKTIIVYIASIIEAMLQWKIKKDFDSKKLELEKEWKYFNIKTLYKINDGQEIIAGARKKDQKPIDSLGLLHLSRFCLKNKIIHSKKLHDDINIIRKFRNKLHIGGLAEVDRKYTKQNLEFCFRTTRQVSKTVRA